MPSTIVFAAASRGSAASSLYKPGVSSRCFPLSSAALIDDASSRSGRAMWN